MAQSSHMHNTFSKAQLRELYDETAPGYAQAEWILNYLIGLHGLRRRLFKQAAGRPQWQGFRSSAKAVDAGEERVDWSEQQFEQEQLLNSSGDFWHVADIQNRVVNPVSTMHPSFP